jgi:hypothetical protein
VIAKAPQEEGEFDPPEKPHDLSGETLHMCAQEHTWVEHDGRTISVELGGPRSASSDPSVCPRCSQVATASRPFALRWLPFDDSFWCAWWVCPPGGEWMLTFHQGFRSTGWRTVYDCIDVRSGERIEVDWTFGSRRASLSEYPARLRQRWWRKGGKLLGVWSEFAPGLEGYIIKGEEVERWVCGAGS